MVLSPLEKPEGHVADKLLIASKIRDEYYLGFHTALEYYGCAHSLYNEAYICVKVRDRFDPFQYGRFSFRPVFVEDTDIEVEDKRYQGRILRVSSKERTFLDCLDRVQYAGGWEECLKRLEGLRDLNFQKVINLVLKREKDILLRRAGYVLELLKKHSPFYEHLNDHLLNRIAERVSGFNFNDMRREVIRFSKSIMAAFTKNEVRAIDQFFKTKRFEPELINEEGIFHEKLREHPSIRWALTTLA